VQIRPAERRMLEFYVRSRWWERPVSPPTRLPLMTEGHSLPIEGG